MKLSTNVASISGALALLGMLWLAPGCGGPAPVEQSSPSYADLVTVYNAELSALDRLERKREELIQRHEAQLKPSTGDAEEALHALLASANEAGKQLVLGETTDPNELLDRAVEHAEKARGITAQLLETAGSKAEPSEEEAQRQAELTEQFERDLAALDQEIAQQKERVARARTARTAAEAAQQ